jgi:hypothetical protein
MRCARWVSRGQAACLALIGSAALAGCSGGGVSVKGTVLQNGQAVRLGAGETLQINFVGMVGERAVLASASYDPADGSFAVAGPTNRGLPEGKYRIAVSTFSQGPKAQGDRFRGAFGLQNSPLVCEVGAGGGDLIIDLGKRAVTAR